MGMFFAAHNFQIAELIVELISVFMVNNFP